MTEPADLQSPVDRQGPTQEDFLASRPTGLVWRALGGIVFVGSVILLAMGALMAAAPNSGGLNGAWWFIVLGAALLSIGLAMLMVGSIIKAIYFLPGEERKFL